MESITKQRTEIEPLLRTGQGSTAKSRLDVAADQGLARVGLEGEVTLLRERSRQSQAGQGQAIVVSGEAGIGKSRLVEAVCKQAAHEGATPLRLRCSPYYQNSAFYPLIELLQHWSGFARGDDAEAKIKKLKRKLEAYQFPEVDTVPLFAQFLSLPPPDGYPPSVEHPNNGGRRPKKPWWPGWAKASPPATLLVMRQI